MLVRLVGVEVVVGGVLVLELVGTGGRRPGWRGRRRVSHRVLRGALGLLALALLARHARGRRCGSRGSGDRGRRRAGRCRPHGGGGRRGRSGRSRRHRSRGLPGDWRAWGSGLRPPLRHGCGRAWHADGRLALGLSHDPAGGLGHDSVHGPALGRAAGPLAQAPHVPGLREVEGGEYRQTHDGGEARVRPDLLDDLHWKKL
jgi:hypothetical protein